MRLTFTSKRYIGRYPGTFPPKYTLNRAGDDELSHDTQSAIAAEKKHVLIVDDDPLFRSLFRVMLRQTGFPFDDIVEADSTASALETCYSRPIDLVFCDLHLTTLAHNDGVGIVRELRQFLPDLPVFIVTSDDDEMVIREESEAGATGHLLKPISLRTLKRILQPCWNPADSS